MKLGWECTRASRKIYLPYTKVTALVFIQYPRPHTEDRQMDPTNHSTPQLCHTNVLEGKLLQHQEQGYYRSPETTACAFAFLFQVSDFFRKQEANLILLTSHPLEEGCLICSSTDKETQTLLPPALFQTRLMPGPPYLPRLQKSKGLFKRSICR